ncbi:uncharacterized protein LOC110901683 [Helianthus annuus]|uniref:uncharacterized protein LOC110901683 n=1 Tax=Helianthus annuus TaxID=4232 RepID=UPI000B8F432C|nr:uncharacterized protein LOC110901683 [Helianthus annuus]
MDYYRSNNGNIVWDWAWTRVPNSEEEKSEMEELVNMLQQWPISSNEDVWFWSGSEQNDFQVKEVRRSLTQQVDLNESVFSFFWNKWTTKKSLMFVWRAIEEKIPTASALAHRGMNLAGTICKTCGAAEETAVHILLQCNFAKRVWEEMTRKRRKAIQVMWHLWKARNEKIFGDGHNTEYVQQIGTV